MFSDPFGAAIQTWNVWSRRHEIAHPSTSVIAKGGDIVLRYVGKNPGDQARVKDILAAVDAAARRNR